MLQVLKWILLLAVLLALCLATWLGLSSRAALDSDYQYTRQVDALPSYTRGAADGIYRLRAGSYSFRLRTAGCAAGNARPAVVLLHGFPVNSAMWLPLIAPLQRAGYCVVAPDLRGYSPGARPAGAHNYSVDKLAADVLDIADATGLQRFHLVGHDWGSIIGWTVVLEHPQRIASWTGLSVPHPAAFAEALQSDPEQRSRSLYFLLFSTPWLPEALLTMRDLAGLHSVYAEMRREQVNEYSALFAEPGALTAALNYYRALGDGGNAQADRDNQVVTPTLFAWGNRDAAVGRRGVELQRQYMSGRYEEVELDAGHWLFVDQADSLVNRVLAHLAANP